MMMTGNARHVSTVASALILLLGECGEGFAELVAGLSVVEALDGGIGSRTVLAVGTFPVIHRRLQEESENF